MNKIIIILAILLLATPILGYKVDMKFEYSDDSGLLHTNQDFTGSSINQTLTSAQYISHQMTALSTLTIIPNNLIDAIIERNSGKTSIRINQNSNNLLIAFTRTGWNEIENKIKSVNYIARKSFTTASLVKPNLITLKLIYNSIDILNTKSWGKGRIPLIISNQGRQNITQIQITSR